MNKRTTLAACTLLLMVVGCVSRYSLSLYMDADNVKRRVKVEQTQYMINARLGDPYEDQKILPGKATCLVLLSSCLGQRVELGSLSVLGYDENLKVRLFFELPHTIQAERLTVKERSFAQMLGRYALPPEEKIFLPDTGSLKIDSLTKDHLYGTLAVRFVNRKGIPLEFAGQFRAKISR
jgi:hypothetical protein